MAIDAPDLPVGSAPTGAEVDIISPMDGATLGENVIVQVGLKCMGVAPAGVDKEKAGHHDLRVDVKDLPPAGQPVPRDGNHLHFGGGQIETTLKLTPGPYILQLEMGDQKHIPFAPALVSKKIAIRMS